MTRKKVQKLPKRISIKCPHCDNQTRLEVSAESNLYKLNCPKCSEEIKTPVTKCCLICAYSKKQCPDSLKREAIVKGLKIK